MTVTVVRDLEVHAFSAEELAMIESALRVAREHWRTVADIMRRTQHPQDEANFARMADAAGELAMKIETSR